MAQPAFKLIVSEQTGDRLAPIMTGDLVRTGESSYPRYNVVATSGDRAWIRDVQDETDHVVPTDRCHRINLPDGV